MTDETDETGRTAGMVRWLVDRHGVTAQDAAETIRLLRSDDPADSDTLRAGIGEILDRLAGDGER